MSLVWTAGVAIATGLLLLRVARLVRLTRRAAAVADGPWRRMTTEIAAHYRIRRPILLLATPRTGDPRDLGCTHAPRAPAGGGFAWSDQRVHAALCHELSHIARLDWPIQVAADILRALFWFNPLFWILPTVCGTKPNARATCRDL